MSGAPVRSGAIFSLCRRWRYALWRTWDDETKRVAFIGLNPSTADEHEDDPTIRRCAGFARAWGYGGLVMLNLFGWRATDPREMRAVVDPVGPGNDAVLREYASNPEVALLVAAWGSDGGYLTRDRAVRNLLAGHDLFTLGLTKSGKPRHPLYLPQDLTPRLWCAATTPTPAA
ncbi:MAG TPA: DUF1643 domain-containing protein [Gemmatimonadaceae bacterium]|nr:DUF1643 domain-containing protein [Gemmatimonadaceae bacterium]